jgi:DNA-directed RNA polymerase sigma subunit (sigma70/sigma32)
VGIALLVASRAVVLTCCSVRWQTRLKKVRNARSQLYLELQREPSAAELAQHLDLPVSKITALRAHRSRTRRFQLEEEVSARWGVGRGPVKEALSDPTVSPIARCACHDGWQCMLVGACSRRFLNLRLGFD